MEREPFMRRAFELRQMAQQQGDQPFGAVVVKEGRVVGEGVSAVVTRRDPTAHTEMEAIRDAARRLGSRDLGGCELYGTSRACPMCEMAAYWARISRLYFSPDIADGGPPRYLSC
jgi:tRNA(Arg) A34 adenosine deaminase TadA